MALIRSSSVRHRYALVTQLGVSITATVVATLIVVGLQHEIAFFRPADAYPALTTGGKFAARVEGLRAATDETFAPATLTQRMPLLVADAALIGVPLGRDGNGAAGPARAVVDLVKPARRVAHAEPKHRPVVEAMADVIPPRRSDVLAETALTVPDEVQSRAAGLWSTTTGLYHEVLWRGGSLLDRVNPVRLLP